MACFGVVPLVCAALAALPQAGGGGNPAVIGQWSQSFAVPAVPVHSVMLHTGEILVYRGDGEDDVSTVPATYTFSLTTGFSSQDPNGANVFCSGHSQLPDGRILQTGGDIENQSIGAKHVNVFDPVTETWEAEPEMQKGRYYPTHVALADGTTLIFGGLDFYGQNNPEVELFIPGAGPRGSDLIQYLVGADKDVSQYPRMHLLPSGKVFMSGTYEDTYTFDPVTRTWHFVAFTQYGNRRHGSSVMLPPGQDRILILGGHDVIKDPVFATDTAEIIDLSAPSPAWAYTTPMHHKRMFPNTIILPDGKVLIVAGSEDVAGTIPIYVSELFDPATETWTEMDAQSEFREYHSSGVLLPDGRVFWGGSNCCPTAEFFSPPYLFKGPRPVVGWSPLSVDYGEPFTVDTPNAAGIASVVFMRPGASTHSTNMEQRYVALSSTQLDADTLAVTAPSEPDRAPPGYYMLFLVDGNGIPSVAPFVRLGGNLAIQVFAGPDQTITLPSGAMLDATVIADNRVTTLWTVVSAPGPVSFGAPAAVDTSVGFFEPGTYVLRLTADDGPNVVSDDVVIDVHAEGTATLVAKKVAASADDAEEAPDGSMSVANSDLELVFDNGGNQTVGLRFAGLAIPAEATIVDAYVQFQVDETPSNPTNLVIEGHDAGDAAAFTSAAFDISARPRTAAAVAWTPAPWPVVGEAGPDQRTPNIAAVIQEIVDRPDWSSGKSLVIIVTGTGERVAEAYDGDQEGAPSLHVAYTSAPYAFADLGGAAPGINGLPKLTANGPLSVGSLLTLELADAAPSAPMLIWLSVSSVPLNVFGGTLYANPKITQVMLASNAAGGFTATAIWPAGVPPQTDLYMQFLIRDLSVGSHLTLSNAVKSTTP